MTCNGLININAENSLTCPSNSGQRLISTGSYWPSHFICAFLNTHTDSTGLFNDIKSYRVKMFRDLKFVIAYGNDLRGYWVALALSPVRSALSVPRPRKCSHRSTSAPSRWKSAIKRHGRWRGLSVDDGNFFDRISLLEEHVPHSNSSQMVFTHEKLSSGLVVSAEEYLCQDRTHHEEDAPVQVNEAGFCSPHSLWRELLPFRAD
jgi:hypothetical protein